MGEIKPSPTIYINNLNEKTAVDVVKEEIEAMFAQFGDVLQVTVMKGRLPNGHYRKGQAWVLFDSIEAASAAKEKMQSFSYHGKEMRIEFSANKSDLLAKRDGTFQPRPKRKYVAPAPGASSDGGDGEDAGGGGVQRGGAARMAARVADERCIVACRCRWRPARFRVLAAFTLRFSLRCVHGAFPPRLIPLFSHLPARPGIQPAPGRGGPARRRAGFSFRFLNFLSAVADCDVFR